MFYAKKCILSLSIRDVFPIVAKVLLFLLRFNVVNVNLSVLKSYTLFMPSTVLPSDVDIFTSVVDIVLS